MTTPIHAESGLEKSVWTEEDLGRLGFHDAQVVAVARIDDDGTGASRFLMDIDYLVRWVHPEPPAKFFSFWICPATLAFEQVWSFAGELEGSSLEIDELGRLDAEDGEGWHIKGHSFDLRLTTSAGFTLYLRRPPVLVDHAFLTRSARGGICFDESGFSSV